MLRTSCALTLVLLAALALLTGGLVASPANQPNFQPNNEPNSSSGEQAPPATVPGKGTVLITGANRGIGLELARQFRVAGYDVIGTARTPDEAKDLRELGAQVLQLDVTDAKSVAVLAAALKGKPIEILINNAGVASRSESIETIDFDDVDRTLTVNTIGPMRVTQALLPNLRAGTRKLVVGISSRLGSIAGNDSGRHFGYRESKAALNMFMRSLAVELKPAGFTCIAMSPGWVRTDMGGAQATLSPEQSVSGIMKVLAALKADDTGKFFGQDGPEVPW